jgi:hypothetical protein
MTVDPVAGDVWRSAWGTDVPILIVADGWVGYRVTGANPEWETLESFTRSHRQPSYPSPHEPVTAEVIEELRAALLAFKAALR